MSELTLALVEERFYRLVTAPEGVARALATEGLGAEAVAELVVGDARLSALDRLEVYAGMYFYRLLDVLRAEYPKLLAVLGDVAFHNLVTDFLITHPPAHPSVRQAGQRLPAFIASHALSTGRPWLAGLAALERARLEVFDAADSPSIDAAWLSALAPAQFPTLSLRLVAAHVVIELDRVVGRAWAAIDAGQTTWPALSATDGAVCPWVIWRGRNPMVVHHRPIDPPEVALLPLLVEGTTFARVCERLGDGRSDEDATRVAAQWLLRWADYALLTTATGELA